MSFLMTELIRAFDMLMCIRDIYRRNTVNTTSQTYICLWNFGKEHLTWPQCSMERSWQTLPYPMVVSEYFSLLIVLGC